MTSLWPCYSATHGMTTETLPFIINASRIKAYLIISDLQKKIVNNHSNDNNLLKLKIISGFLVLIQSGKYKFLSFEK
jgi:hypothetical protein